MYAALFDRFATDEVGPEAVANHLADVLSGRRAFMQSGLGVVGWGMPPLLNRVANSSTDREYVAACIAATINEFDPRLEGVKVTPVEDAKDFSFVIEAMFATQSSTINLRILSPFVGGGLGAKVEVVSVRDDFDDSRDFRQ